MPTTSSLADRFGPPKSYSGFVGPFAVSGGSWYGRNPVNLTSYPTMTAGSKQGYIPPSVLSTYAADHPSNDPVGNYWKWIQAQQDQAGQQAGQAAAGGVSMGTTGLMPGQSGATSGYRIPSSAIPSIPQVPFNAPGAINVPSTVSAAATGAAPTGRSKKSATGTTQTSKPAVNDPIGAYISNLIGNAQPGQGGVWGGVPNVPDPTSTAGAAISGDIANLPALTELAGGINQFNTGQAVAPYIANLPGYQDMVKASSGNIEDLLAGKVPADVISIMQEQAAERGVGGGFGPDSPNTNAAYLRALGLTSLGEKQQGETELTNAIARTPTAPLFNVASFLNSPADEQAAQMYANLYASAPNPQQQGEFMMSLFNRLLQQQALGAGGGGGVSRSVPGGGGGPPTDLFGQPWAGLGAGGASPGASGGSNVAPTTIGGGWSPGQRNMPGAYGYTTTGGASSEGTAQGPNEGTGEGTVPRTTPGLSPNYSSGPYGFNVNDPIWQSIFGYDPTNPDDPWSTTGNENTTLTAGSPGSAFGPSNIFTDPFWNQTLGGGSVIPGDFSAGMGQAAGGLPDYLSPQFDWAGWLASGGDYGSMGDFGDEGG